jgi:hypothetical protein
MIMNAKIENDGKGKEDRGRGRWGGGGIYTPSPGNRARLQLQTCTDQLGDGDGDDSVYLDDSISGTVFTRCPSFPGATGACPLAPESPRPLFSVELP